jgi:hypothetical protein
MYVHLLTGRWDEAEALGSELLARGSGGTEYVRERLVHLHALRGALPAARASLEGMAAWSNIDMVDHQRAYSAARGIVAILAGDGEAGLELLREAMGGAEGDVSEYLRVAWPEAVGTALALGRVDDAAELLGLLDGLPPGHRPPYLDAQRDRLHALVSAARGEDDRVETELRRAIAALRGLGYPYWLAVAQTDLAGWLIGAGRRDEAATLLHEATATLMPLRAVPALGRANELLSAVPGAVAAS